MGCVCFLVGATHPVAFEIFLVSGLLYLFFTPTKSNIFNITAFRGHLPCCAESLSPQLNRDLVLSSSYLGKA